MRRADTAQCYTENMKGRFLIIAIILIVLCAAISVYVFNWLRTDTQNNPRILLSVDLPGGDRLYAEEADAFSIDVTYPGTTQLEMSANDAAILRIEETLKERIDEFKKDAAAFVPNPEAGERPWQLSITYEPYESPQTISDVFLVYVDTGGAHPNHYFETVVFDHTGRLLSLPDVFLPGTDLYSAIAQEVRPLLITEIKRRLAEGGEEYLLDAWFEEGIAPKEENYKNWVLSARDISFFFPPYQVAAYAAGDFMVSVPIERFRSMLKPDFQGQ